MGRHHLRIVVLGVALTCGVAPQVRACFDNKMEGGNQRMIEMRSPPENSVLRRIRNAAEGSSDAPLRVGQAYAQARSSPPGGSLLAPETVVLYVHARLQNTQFVDPLACALERMLRARIVVKRLDLLLGPELLATPTQFDVGKIADLFFQATSSYGGPRTFRYFLMDEDLKDPQLRYVFAESFGAPWHVGIVSTARLVGNDGRPGDGRADVTALRVYKLVLKSVARLAGYTESQDCILSFPRSLPELDRKSSEFCDHDRLALVDAGILKPTPSGGCAQIATILP